MQLLVKMYHPWVLHFVKNKNCISKPPNSSFPGSKSPKKNQESIEKVRNSLLRGAGTVLLHACSYFLKLSQTCSNLL